MLTQVRCLLRAVPGNQKQLTRLLPFLQMKKTEALPVPGHGTPRKVLNPSPGPLPRPQQVPRIPQTDWPGQLDGAAWLPTRGSGNTQTQARLSHQDHCSATQRCWAAQAGHLQGQAVRIGLTSQPGYMGRKGLLVVM